MCSSHLKQKYIKTRGKTITIAFPPTDKITDSAIMHREKKSKKKELHNFYNHTILHDDNMCPSVVVAAAGSEGVCRMYVYVVHTSKYNVYIYVCI